MYKQSLTTIAFIVGFLSLTIFIFSPVDDLEISVIPIEDMPEDWQNQDDLRQDGVFTPAPGTMVSTGDTISVYFALLQNDPDVTSAKFLLDGVEKKMLGAGPYSFEYQVPDNKVGFLGIEVYTYGGANQYQGHTYLAVSPPGEITRIEVSPDSLTDISATSGKDYQLTVTGFLDDGTELNITTPDTGTEYDLESGYQKAVSINSRGLVTALRQGRDVIIVTHKGNEVKIPVAVDISNRPPKLILQDYVTMNVDEVFQVPIGATDPDGNNLTLSVIAFEGTFGEFVDEGGGSGVMTFRPNQTHLGKYEIFMHVEDDGVPALGEVKKFTLFVENDEG